MNANRKQAEEILQKHLNLSSFFPVDKGQYHFIILAMEEYAQLSSPLPEITEEEIMKAEDDFYLSANNDGNKCIWRHGFDYAISLLSERKEQKTTEEIHLHVKTREVLKPIEDLYRKEHPHPDGKFYLPDTTEFYKWIVKKIMDK